jgi:hypothetical protein
MESSLGHRAQYRLSEVGPWLGAAAAAAAAAAAVAAAAAAAAAAATVA